MKFVYTSSLAVSFRIGHETIDADETMPYPEERYITNGYMATKIEAEKMVIDANDNERHDRGLKTVAVRPCHIFGAGCDCFYLKDVPVYFAKAKDRAVTSACNVENCAFLHLIAGARLSPGPKQVRPCIHWTLLLPVQLAC